jgi:hypothetical protein
LMVMLELLLIGFIQWKRFHHIESESAQDYDKAMRR